MPRCPPPGATPSGGHVPSKGSTASGSQQGHLKQPQKQHRVRQQSQSQQLHSQLVQHASDSESSSRSRSTAPSTAARPTKAAQRSAKKQAARRATTQKRTPQQRKAADKRVKQAQGSSGSLRPQQLPQHPPRVPKKKGHAEEQQQLQQQLQQLEEQQQFLQHRRQQTAQTAQPRSRIKRLNACRQQSVSYSTGSDSRSRSSSRVGSPQPGRTVRASLRRRPGASQSPPFRSRSRSPHAERWMESDWYGYGGGVGDLWQEPLESYYDWYSSGDGFGPDGGDLPRQRSRSWGGKGQGCGKGRGRGNKGQSRVSLRGRENLDVSTASRTRVHVANLPKNFSAEGVTRLFQQHGKVLGVQLLTANQNKGEVCAIVRYGDGSAAQKAISALNGSEDHGETPLVVKYARPNPRWESRS